jgi:DNA ligase-1
MTVYDIIQELNQENGSNYKMAVLKKYSDHVLLKRVLKMTYDRATYTYGISMKNIPPYNPNGGSATLELALLELDEYFAPRKITGNAAIERLTDIHNALGEDEATVFRCVINRDLRINLGRTNINKVYKNLIVKPLYMRCALFNDKTKLKINPKNAIVQLKADGTYREFRVENGIPSAITRSGQECDYPMINQELSDFPDGYYFGELTVWESGRAMDRATGNGLINSSEPPHDKIILELWDYVSPLEYANAANKVKGTTPYYKRLDTLKAIVFGVSPIFARRIRVIETYEVQSFAEALAHCSDWMTAGYEGAILKDRNAIFRDGTSPQQLKLKLEIDADVRITGFLEGKVGTKREATFGSILFQSDDGKVKGRTSGFTDEQLEDFNSRRAELIGQIMTVTFNDLTQGRANEHYALSHPRFVELRNDKDETDTLERMMESKQMAMAVGE